jgi:hypothetical protein
MPRCGLREASVPVPRQWDAGAVKVLLTAVDSDLYEAWQRFCGDVEIVEVRRTSILDAGCDALVSPANSFGFMDGGIDALYLRHFGAAWATESGTQSEIDPTVSC